VRKGESKEIAARRLDLHGNAMIVRGRETESVPTTPAPPTGISYLDLVADGFYKGKK
jgi:hypothetical protein